MFTPEEIYRSNIINHKIEAPIYDQNHPEIFNGPEQRRINKLLLKLSLSVGQNKQALDFGAGTGNITEKLLKLGYYVTAVDLSRDMCLLLKKKLRRYTLSGRLSIINSNIESFQPYLQYDLITCYSVLHHLPDYVSSVKKLSLLLRKGGYIYLDHEPSPYYWSAQGIIFRKIIDELIVLRCLKSYTYKNYKETKKNMNIVISDYWVRDSRHIEHDQIEAVFRANSFSLYKRIDYNMRLESYWLARK